MRTRMMFGRIGFFDTRHFITLQNERKIRDMIGTLVNTGTILVGSIAGSCLRHGIKEQYRGALWVNPKFCVNSICGSNRAR